MFTSFTTSYYFTTLFLFKLKILPASSSIGENLYMYDLLIQSYFRYIQFSNFMCISLSPEFICIINLYNQICLKVLFFAMFGI